MNSLFISLLLKCLFFSHGSGFIMNILSIDKSLTFSKRYKQFRPQREIFFKLLSTIFLSTSPKPLIKTSHPMKCVSLFAWAKPNKCFPSPHPLSIIFFLNSEFKLKLWYWSLLRLLRLSPSYEKFLKYLVKISLIHGQSLLAMRLP